MTIKFNNVYLNETATITGPYEEKGPLSKYFDYSYDDLYFKMPSWERAESKLINDAIDMVLGKAGKTKFDIDYLISGDLLNQITASSYAASSASCSFIGIYAACASSTLGLAIGSSLVENGFADNVLCTVSSHNNGAEKQFRYPVEYGGPKPKTATFTATGGAAALLSNEKSNIRVESATFGSVIDSEINDAFHMGAVMAPAAASTIYKHLVDTGRGIDYYDLVLTGDLGIYGKDILKDFMKTEYNILLNRYDDAGVMLYDLKEQPVYAGASGPVCAPLVLYGYIIDQMKKGKYKRVLVAATGALHSLSMVNQKLTIPAICHAISLEVAE